MKDHGTESILTTEALARRWHVSPKTVAGWRARGDGPRFFVIGRSIRYRLEDIEEFERSTLAPPGAVATDHS